MAYERTSGFEGEFMMFGTGPLTEDVRQDFQQKGLRPGGNIGAAASPTGSPIQDFIAAWFYLESVSPGFAGALANSAIQALTGTVGYILGRMNEWVRSGESPMPEAVNTKIVIGFGPIDSPNRKDIEITLGPDRSVEDIQAIVESALSENGGPKNS